MSTNAIDNIPEERKFLRAADVEVLLEVGRSKAYEIIRQLNKELEDQGKITVPGRVSRKYLLERCYY